jgi:thioredoxin-related protein
MKNFIFILLSIFIFNFVSFADEIISIVKLGPGVVYSYEDAMVLSKESGSDVFIYFSADWCKYCTSMKNDTLENKEAKKHLLKNFVFLNINVDENKKIKNKYNVKSLPDCVIVNSNGEVIKRSSGYKSPEKFLQWIEE